MHFTSTTTCDGIAERTFTVGEINGVLWLPESATVGAPLLLIGRCGGLYKYAAGLVSQARRAVAGDGSGNGSGDGFTVAAIDAPGHDDRPRSDQDQRQVDAPRPAPAAGERALVLHGGGSAGNAWEIGVIAGLFDAGLDVTEADLIIGTSAGSTAAAQITSATPTELLAAILAAAPQPRTGPVGSDGGRVPIGPAAGPYGENERESSPPLRMRPTCAAEWVRRRSKWMRRRTAPGKRGGALPSPPGCPVSAGRNEGCSSRRSMPIPVNRSCSTATAESTWWTPLPPACANGFGVPPYSIGDNRYIDGGYRRNENADLAAGYGRVLVLSPFGGRSRHPLDWGMHLAAQVDELRARGSRVETILPDSNSRDAFGGNLMDLSTRPPAARAGYNQGRALAEQLTEFWR